MSDMSFQSDNSEGSGRSSPFEEPCSHDHIDILLDVDDLQEPLLPTGSAEASGRGNSDNLPSPVTGVAPKESPPFAVWPALRRSSVSVRKVSPVVGFDPQEILSPHASSSLELHRGYLFGKLRGQQQQQQQQQQEVAREVPPTPSRLRQHLSAAAPAMSTANEAPQLRPHPFPSATSPSPINIGTSSPIRKPGIPLHALLTGSINAVIGLPVMLSFAAIIFRHPFFSPYLSALVKMVFLSAALHQAVFACGSSMRFAIGQVQDVGLIFLSAIASDVVEDCRRAGVSDADTLGTVLAALSLGTMLVGALIMATGALRLAAAVQYCPLPVVGAYLAAVGWFCLTAGISLASGVQLTGAGSWAVLASDGSALVKLIPAVAMGISLTVVQQRSRSPYALPIFLMAVPIAFYTVVFVGGWTLDDVRAAGWMAKTTPEDSEWRFWKMYSLYNIHLFPPRNLHWASLPRQVGKLAGLFFVVAFGSSMDIAAIQADAPFELDYSSELVTVGLSNVLAGSFGVGFTGSYIFSQTLFSLKMGIDTPAMGAVVSLAELAAFMLPANAMAYLPDFYFASLVMWIGVDILKDWLFIASKKVSSTEYALLVGTFLSIAWFGLEAGIGLGVVAAAVHFAFEYARVSVKAFAVVPSRSGAVRSFHHRLVLEAFAGRVVAVSLSGMIFFGSATAIAEQVQAVAEALLETQPHATPGEITEARQTDTQVPGLRSKRNNRPMSEISSRTLRTVPSERSLCRQYDCIDALKQTEGGVIATGAALQAAPLVLLLDVSRVHGIDATAARTFVTLHAKLQRRGVRLALTGLRGAEGSGRMQKLLVGQGLILQEPTHAENDDYTTNTNSSVAIGIGGDNSALSRGDEPLEPHGSSSSPPTSAAGEGTCAWFPSMEAGLHWCEEQFLCVAQQYGLCDPPPQVVTLEDVLRVNLEVPRLILGPTPINYQEAASHLESVCDKQHMSEGEVIFERSQPADAIFIVEEGSVVCCMDFQQSSVHSRAASAAVPGGLGVSHREHLLKFGPGGIFGDLDFMLQRQRSFTARCAPGGGGTLWVLSRAAFERLARDSPHVLVLLQTVVLRLNCLSATHALEALERSQL